MVYVRGFSSVRLQSKATAAGSGSDREKAGSEKTSARDTIGATPIEEFFAEHGEQWEADEKGATS